MIIFKPNFVCVLVQNILYVILYVNKLIIGLYIHTLINISKYIPTLI